MSATAADVTGDVRVVVASDVVGDVDDDDEVSGTTRRKCIVRGRRQESGLRTGSGRREDGRSKPGKGRSEISRNTSRKIEKREKQSISRTGCFQKVGDHPWN